MKLENVTKAGASLVRMMLAFVAVLLMTTPVLAAGTISGTITDSSTGAGIDGLFVIAYNADNQISGYDFTDSAGNYTIDQLTSGYYKLSVDGQGYIPQWYSGKSSISSADAVAVVDSTTSGINFSLVKGGSITGTVTDKDTGALLSGQWVYLYDAADSWVTYDVTGSTGTYTLTGLAPGAYRVSFEGSSGYLRQWYDGATELASATPIAVSGGNTVSGIDGALRKGGSISGTVTDSLSGLPIADVSVIVYDSVTGSWIDSTTTDSSGAYTIGALNGSYMLRFSGAGYIETYYSAAGGAAATAVVVAAPNNITGIDVVMTEGGSISGTVTDSSTGAGIDSVLVSVYGTDGSGSYAYTDSTGAYTVSGLPTDSYDIEFSGAGYIPRSYDGGTGQGIVAVTAPAAISDINVALTKGGTISGRVTARETGSPVVSARVTAYDADTDDSVSIDYTDSSGVYSVGQLPTGRYKIFISADSDSGLIDQWYSNKNLQSLADIVEVVAPNTVANMDVSLEKGATITGVVKDGTSGALLAGVRVSVYDADSGILAGWRSNTDSSGAYSIGGLPSGSYLLQFSRSAYIRQWYAGKADQSTATAVAVTAPDTTSGINVDLLKGGSISGRLTDAASGAGIADVYISVIDRSTGDWGGSTYTDQDGNYAITGLASGSYRLYINPDDELGYTGGWYAGTVGGLCAGVIPVTAPDATSGIDVRLSKGGSIAGRITDAVTGLGIADAAVYVSPVSLVGTGTASYYAYTDATGAYVANGVVSGEYSVTFRAGGYVDSTLVDAVTVVAPAAVTGIDRALAKGGEIRGRITDSATGAGVGDVVVEAYDPDNNAWVWARGASDDTGAYTIRGIPSGRYQLYFDGREAPGSYGFGFVTLDEPISVSAPAVVTGVDFTIDYLGSISGIVTDSAGKGLIHIPVAVYDGVNGYLAGSGYTGSGGTYVVTGLPTGSYRVKFGYSNGTYIGTWYGSGSASALAPEVTVQAPQITSGIDGRLVKGGSISGSILVDGCASGSITIEAYDLESGDLMGRAWVSLDSTDKFTIAGLPTGSYKLAVDPGSTGIIRQWYPNKNDMASAESIAVTAGSVTDGIQVRLAVGGGSIAGRIPSSRSCGLLLTTVELLEWPSGGLVDSTLTLSGQNYGFSGLADGTYKLRFSAGEFTRWHGASGSAQAAPLVISGGNALTGIDLALPCSPDGDFDGNGELDLLDALKALRIAVGQGTATAGNLSHGDLAPMVNGVSVPDGVIDISDVLLILRKVVEPNYYY